MEVQDLLEYVNSELANGSNLTKFAKGLGKNESTIRKKLNKAGYKRVGNKFVLNVDTTSSITSISINTEKTKVTSLRINEDIYNLIKERAVRDKCSISDIVNKSLMDYLNNYL